jgi:hypothetical protein
VFEKSQCGCWQRIKADETDENPMFLRHFIRFIRYQNPLPPPFQTSSN